MRKQIAILVLLFLASLGLGAYASTFSNETLHYVITYKWGLVQKDAGEAT